MALADTGLGNFYEYFASKDDLARVCVHLRSKVSLAALRDAVARQRGAGFAAIVDSQLEAPREWAAHYMLERHLSSPQAYRKMYERFVDDWCVALQSASDLPAPATTRDVACVSHAILYGCSRTPTSRPPAAPSMQGGCATKCAPPCSGTCGPSAWMRPTRRRPSAP